jgi:hypothetical protein
MFSRLAQRRDERNETSKKSALPGALRPLRRCAKQKRKQTTPPRFSRPMETERPENYPKIPGHGMAARHGTYVSQASKPARTKGKQVWQPAPHQGSHGF